MTLYTEMFDDAWESQLDVNGETVIVRPLGVTANQVSITAVFTRRQVIPMNASDARQYIDGGDLRYREADVSGSYAVNVEDTVYVDSKVYAVTRIVQRTPVIEVALEHRDDKRVGNRNRLVR